MIAAAAIETHFIFIVYNLFPCYRPILFNRKYCSLASSTFSRKPDRLASTRSLCCIPILQRRIQATGSSQG